MDGGGVLLERNPLKGLTLPKEETPKRAIVTGEQYQALRKVAVRRGPLLELIRILCHDTGHRVGGVRRLRWSDIDLERRTVHWRGEYDKLGKDHVTPLANDAVAAPTNVRRMQKTIGDTWIFPAKTDPQRHWSRGGVERRWKWMAKRAGLPIRPALWLARPPPAICDGAQSTSRSRISVRWADGRTVERSSRAINSPTSPRNAPRSRSGNCCKPGGSSEAIVPTDCPQLFARPHTQWGLEAATDSVVAA